MKRHRIWAGLLGVLVCCVSMMGSIASREAAAEVTLTFWHTMNEKETPTLLSIVEEFQQARPDIKVNVEYVPYGDAQSKFEIAAQTGAAPDIMRADVPLVSNFADAGYLLALDEYVSAEDKADYLPVPMSYNTYQGKIWGIPQVTDVLALLYNKRLLKEAGHDNPPTTLAEMEQLVADVKAKLGIEGFYMRGDAYWYLCFLWAFGGDLVDKDRNMYINDEHSLNALEYFVSQKDKLFPGNTDFANDYNDAMTLFKEGKTAMIINGPWATADILSGKEFQDAANLGVAVFPKGPNGQQGAPVGGHNYIISADTKFPKEAYTFIEFINQTKYQARFAAQNNLMPSRLSAYKTPEVESNPIIQGFLAQMEFGRNRSVLPESALLLTPMTPNIRAAWRGDKTPKQALDDIAAEWKALLKQEE